jgi:CDP-glycerol glycerophosphotransferase
VTVVVPVYQAEPYLEECLRTLRAQKHENLQIVVVDDGSTDGSRDIYQRHAAADGRIEVVRQVNRGLGAARNAGIARARGDYLTFLDADDLLPARAYRVMVAALEESGSDFATGAVQRITHGRKSVPSWIREVHDVDRRGITIDDFPRAVMDVIACNRMFRTSAWRRMGLAFPEGVAYEDHVPMMTAYVRGRFDILRDITYLWRIREDRSSIGQQKHSVDNLRDRLEAKRGAREVLEQEASPAVLAAWQSRVLDMDLRLFVDEVPGVDDEYWGVLRDGVREHVDAATPEVWADVRVEQRVRDWLVANDRRPSLETLLARSETGATVVRAHIEGDRPVAELDIDLPASDAPPAELLVMGERELVYTVSLRSVTVDDDHLVLVLAPRLGPVVDGLDAATLLVHLTDQSQRVVSVAAEMAGPEVAARWAESFSGTRWPDLRVARIPAAAIADGDARWRVEVEYVVGDRRFRAPITTRDPDGVAGRPPTQLVGARRLDPVWQAHSGLSIAVVDPRAEGAPVAPDSVPATRPLLVVDEARLSPTSVELHGRWLGGAPDGDLCLDAGSGATMALQQQGDGAAVVLSCSWTTRPMPGVWRLRAPGGALDWVDAALLGRLPLVVDAEGERLGVIRDTDDGVALRVAGPRR